MGAADTNKNADSVSLKVMYFDERAFFDEYGMLFSALHPEVEIEVVSTRNAMQYEPGKDMENEMEKFILAQKPDILMLTPDQYAQMSSQGKLMELDNRVEEKDFGKEGLMPGLLDYLRDLGGGKLYGLVPSFYSQAIFFNKDLFEKYNVELPRDKMTWEDVFRLASMFPTDGSGEERIYGLKMSYGEADLYQIGSTIGTSFNLNILDASATQITMNSEAWKKVFETALSVKQSGALYSENPDNMAGGNMRYEDYLLRDPFISGRAAMLMESNYIVDQIKQAQETVKDKAIQNWDMVTMPVDPANPEVSPFISVNHIFAVSSASGHPEAAWTFLQYIHSDEFARVTSKRQRGSMSVRTQYLKDDEGHNFAAFYALRPVQPAMSRNYEKVPQEFWMNFHQMAVQELKEAEDGRKTVAEALDSLQAKAQDALLQAKLKQEQQQPAASEGASATGQVSVGIAE